MKRRNFLRTASIATAIGPFVYNGFAINPMAHNTVFSKLGAAASFSNKIMVFIELNGGNDGLNTLIPLDQYGNLSIHRPGLLIPENQVLKLDGTDATGLHPSMTGIQKMYKDGLVSIVQNVGYPNQDYSHFRSMDIWMTASDSDESLDSGWLGRTLELEYPDYPTGYPNPDNPDPLAIQVGSVVPISFMGSVYPMGMSISSADSFYNQYINDYVEPAPDTPYGDELEYIRLIMQQSQQYYNAIKTAAGASQNLSDKYPPANQNSLADQLKVVARLIGGGLQTPIYMVSIRGFDTHSQQTNRQALLLHQISEAVAAFQDDITLMGYADKVAGMTFSEFGRTIAENASAGTDHGAAAPVFVFGKGVNPGIIGQNAQIKQNLEPSEDVPMQHDFRAVYASVLQDWFGLSGLEAILFDDFPILPIFKGLSDTHDLTRRDFFQVGNFPNPVHSSTTITFTIPAAHVVVNLLDLQGRFILKIAEGDYPSGTHRLAFDRGSLPSGTYLYQVVINGLRIARKMLVL